MRYEGPLEFHRRPFFYGLLIAIVGALPLQQLAGAEPSCSSLAALTIPNVRVIRATAVAAGPFAPPGASRPLTLPAFCRVEAVATPVSDSTINFEEKKAPSMMPCRP